MPYYDFSKLLLSFGHDLGASMFINNVIEIGYNIGMFSMSRTIEKMFMNKQ